MPPLEVITEEIVVEEVLAVAGDTYGRGSFVGVWWRYAQDDANGKLRVWRPQADLATPERVLSAFKHETSEVKPSAEKGPWGGWYEVRDLQGKCLLHEAS